VGAGFPFQYPPFLMSILTENEMNQTVIKILTILGINRKKPTTRFGKFLRRFEYAVSMLCVMYIFILAYPQPLFAHAFEHEGICLYSRQPIPSKEAATLLSEIRSRLRTSEINQELSQYKIFLCNSQYVYTIFCPLSRHSLGCAQLSGYIFIANADLANNTVTAFRAENRERSFVSVVSHEICHQMCKQKFGFWSDFKAPAWLKEGYCEYVSNESSFPKEKGNRLLSEGKEDESKSFEYFVYRRMVAYCLTQKECTIKELFAKPPTEQDVKIQMCISTRFKGASGQDLSGLTVTNAP
jgi:hypothetical protein